MAAAGFETGAGFAGELSDIESGVLSGIVETPWRQNTFSVQKCWRPFVKRRKNQKWEATWKGRGTLVDRLWLLEVSLPRNERRECGLRSEKPEGSIQIVGPSATLERKPTRLRVSEFFIRPCIAGLFRQGSRLAVPGHRSLRFQVRFDNRHH